jgi:hypothetical protein
LFVLKSTLQELLKHLIEALIRHCHVQLVERFLGGGGGEGAQDDSSLESSGKPYPPQNFPNKTTFIFFWTQMSFFCGKGAFCDTLSVPNPVL